MEELMNFNIETLIYEIRGQRVMLDRDLAMLYQVTTKAFNQAVKRNIERFPEDFMFQLTRQEYANLRSQFVTSSLEITENKEVDNINDALALLSSDNSQQFINSQRTRVKGFTTENK